jgi:hypothetical protein
MMKEQARVVVRLLCPDPGDDQGDMGLQPGEIEVCGDLGNHPLTWLAAIEVLNRAICGWFDDQIFGGVP